MLGDHAVDAGDEVGILAAFGCPAPALVHEGRHVVGRADVVLVLLEAHCIADQTCAPAEQAHDLAVDGVDLEIRANALKAIARKALARKTGRPAHILHVSTAEELEYLKDFRDIAIDYLRICRDENMRYAEISFDPQPHTERGVAFGAIIDGLQAGINEAKAFGVIESDANGRIVAFHEKSPTPPTMIDDPTRCLASMGNYVFNTKTLIDIVTPTGDDEHYTDIGGHIIPALTAQGVAHVYDFSTNEVPGQDQREKGYWRDVGTIDSYYDCNMDLLAPVPVFNLYNNEWPVYTLNDSMPPAKISRGAGGEPAYVDGSLLCAGSIVSGAHVERMLVGPTAEDAGRPSG